MGFSMVMGTILGTNSAFAGFYAGTGFNSYFAEPYLYLGVDVYKGRSTGSVEFSYFKSDDTLFIVTMDVEASKLMYVHDVPITDASSALLGAGIGYVSGANTLIWDEKADPSYSYTNGKLLLGVKTKLTDNIDLRLTFDTAVVKSDDESPDYNTTSIGISYKF